MMAGKGAKEKKGAVGEGPWGADGSVGGVGI